MKSLIDFDGAAVFAIPVLGGGVHEGMLIEGPQGWGEFSPGSGCGVEEATRRLTAALEPGTVGWPDPVRGRVPIAVAVPFVSPGRAHEMVASSGCSSADVQVGTPGSLSDDIARLEAVRDALGSDGVVRCDLGGRWDVAAAVAAIPLLDKAAGGLGYVEQPCAAVDDVAQVRRRIDIRVAMRATVGAPTAEAADVCILSAGPLGGVRRALRVAEMCALPCTVATTLVTSVGLAGELALAGVLPQLDFACGLGVIGALAGDVVREGRSLIPVDGYLPVSPMPPGPEPTAVDRFAITDLTRVSYWRELLRAAQH